MQQNPVRADPSPHVGGVWGLDCPPRPIAHKSQVDIIHKRDNAPAEMNLVSHFRADL